MIQKINNTYQITIDKNITNLRNIDQQVTINWSMFDKIVCIHYLPYSDRLEPIKVELKRIGILDLPQFEFYFTVDNQYYLYVLDGLKAKNKIFGKKLTTNNIKYAIDTLSLLKKLDYFNYKNVLIIEDDIVFLKNLVQIKKIIDSIPLNFDIVNFDPFIYVENDSNISDIEKKYPIVNNYFLYYNQLNVFNASCIGFSRKAIQQIISNQDKLFLPFDWYTWLKTENLNTYCVLNDYHLCIQDSRAYINKQYVGQFDKRYKLDTTQFNCKKPLPTIAIVAIARLENLYINEWIDYHKKLGFCHIYIYDNSCNDEAHINTILSEENKNVSTIIPAYNKYSYQKDAYEHAYSTYGNLYDYMLFIDIDEFFTLMKHNNIVEYIEYLNSKCPNFQSARIHWELYDDNNSIERDLTIPVHKFFTQQALTNNAQIANTTTKSIIRCKIPDMYFPSVHYSESRSQELITCNSVGKKIYPTSQMIKERDVSVAKIRHYATKTISEYMQQKLCRNDAAGYIVRDIENRFFIYCKKTQQKIDYYEQHKNLTKYKELAEIKQSKDDVLTYWYWYDNKNFNAGDIYNKYLIEHLYNCKLQKSLHSYPDVCFCGSILLDKHIKNCKNIVGCGFQYVKRELTPPLNANYLAIRGKITKDILMTTYNIKISDNILLCDPGILISYLYNPIKKQKKYSIGIIPHWSEEQEIKEKYNDKYHIISMKTDNIESLINEIVSCEIIISSSLHGIIFSHSYGIPAYHVEFNDFYNNGNIKFKDYYSSFNDLQYKKFIATDFDIPFNEILRYDNEKRSIANPSMKSIIEKQQQFIKILPYKEVLIEHIKDNSHD